MILLSEIMNHDTGGLLAMLLTRVNIDEMTSAEDVGQSLAAEFNRMAVRNLSVLWFAVDWYPDELVILSRWLEPIGGLFPSDGLDWVEWISQVRLCDELFDG